MRNSATRGGALLAVLWLSAGLSAIAFTVATRVRAETERTSTSADGLRAHYLASASIERAILWIYWGSSNHLNADGTPRFYQPPMPRLVFPYATGEAVVEVIPEGGKLNVNNAAPEELMNVLLAAGVAPERARQLTENLVEARRPGPPMPPLPLSENLPSSFPPRHASFEELEEILLVPGMTEELFYGGFRRDDSGRLVPHGGLRDSFTVFGSGYGVDVNTAPPALLQSLGILPEAVGRIVAARAAKPFKTMDEVMPLVGGAPGASRLRIGGNSIWTLRATARVKRADGTLGDLRRSVSAVVKFLDPGKWDPPYHILRWYDDAWSPGL